MVSATQKARCLRYEISVCEPARTYEAVGGIPTLVVDACATQATADPSVWETQSVVVNDA